MHPDDMVGTGGDADHSLGRWDPGVSFKITNHKNALCLVVNTTVLLRQLQTDRWPTLIPGVMRRSIGALEHSLIASIDI
jgi:hypothetical protein